MSAVDYSIQMRLNNPPWTLLGSYAFRISSMNEIYTAFPGIVDCTRLVLDILTKSAVCSHTIDS